SGSEADVRDGIPPRAPRLSRREYETLNAAARGLTTRETADALGIDFEAVKHDRDLCRSKLEARSIALAVALGIYAGIVHQDFELPRRGRRPGGRRHALLPECGAGARAS